VGRRTETRGHYAGHCRAGPRLLVWVGGSSAPAHALLFMGSHTHSDSLFLWHFAGHSPQYSTSHRAPLCLCVRIVGTVVNTAEGRGSRE
jgi:hypothetical protein